MPKPIRLETSRHEKVWGRTKLQPWFADSPAPVGEVWFETDPRLPILVKLIFTTERLSVQVHPADGDGVAVGKTEMWYILEAEPGATIALGFKEPISRERLLAATHSGEIETLLNWIPVKPGETYLTPARTVHAIGAGIVLLEVQQNTDVTYRLWDYGRDREIHVDQAAPLADLGVHPGAITPRELEIGREELVRCPYFTVELTRLAAGETLTPEPQRCQLWMPVEGCGNMSGESFRPGQTWLFPESGEQPAIQAESAVTLLRACLP